MFSREVDRNNPVIVNNLANMINFISSGLSSTEIIKISIAEIAHGTMISDEK